MTEATLLRPAGAFSRRHPKIVITNWVPRIKRSLRGFFSARLPGGMILRGLALHERDEARWIEFPQLVLDGAAKGWVEPSQEFVEFRDDASAERFHKALLAALDEHLENR